MTRWTTIDLTGLAPPDVVETLDAAEIRQAIIDDFRARYPQYDAVLESDPFIKLMEAVAYREVLLRARVNDAARAVMLPLARGADLDQLAALFRVERRHGEDDAALRQRVHLAIEAYSAAGPPGAYAFHAKMADERVYDASATMTRPGRVVVTVMDESGGAPEDMLDAVRQRVTADDIKPLTDSVSVRGPRVHHTRVVAGITLYPGPDQATVLGAARARLESYLAEHRRLGANLRRSSLTARLFVEGVESLTIHEPAADIVLDPGEVFSVDEIVLRVEGRSV